MDKRNQRLLEEVLKLPGNGTCADCHNPAPRWASVNLGIFLCVSCASIHRKMGTHTSRVKSVTLDDWSRDQIKHIKSIGNTSSNHIYNPTESLHPPPTASGAEERDSEMEKYIRRKYEQGAFKAHASNGALAPTSLNRARERDGRGVLGDAGGVNRRNPELNSVVVKKDGRERDLPALPTTPSSIVIPPRGRPRPSPSSSSTPSALPTASSLGSNQGSANGNGHANTNGTLIDLSGGTSSTLPLQINSAYSGSNGVTASSYEGGQGWAGQNGMGGTGGNHLGVGMGLGMNGQGCSMSYSAPSTSTHQSFNPFHQQQPQQLQMQQTQQQYPQSAFQTSFPSSSYPTPQYQSQSSQSSFQPQAFQQHTYPSTPSAFPGVSPSMNGFQQQPVSSPYGQSPMGMGMQHANGSSGYFNVQGQGQGQAHAQMQGMGQLGYGTNGMPNMNGMNGMNMGMGMGMGMGMNGMGTHNGQYGQTMMR